MHKRKLAKVIDCCFELKEEKNEKNHMNLIELLNN